MPLDAELFTRRKHIRSQSSINFTTEALTMLDELAEAYEASRSTIVIELIKQEHAEVFEE
jgi:hypothetical protein